MVSPRGPYTRISQIPPDLVVKTQAIDIVEVIAYLLRRSDVVQTSWRTRKSRCERLSPPEAHWSTTKFDGMCFNLANGRYWAAQLHQFRRDRCRTRELAEAVMALSEEEGFAQQVAQGLFLRG